MSITELLGDDDIEIVTSSTARPRSNRCAKIPVIASCSICGCRI